MLAAQGQVKVLDLGLARPQTMNDPEQAAFLTQPGQWLGTPHYMSPEQGLVKAEIDRRSDIYSLGCTLYKLLTGETPFGSDESSTVLTILMEHANAEFPRIAKLRPEVPKGLSRLIDQMVAKKPEGRIDSAAKVARQLEPFCKRANLKGLYQASLSGGLVTPRSAQAAKTSWRALWFLVPVVAVLVVWAAFHFTRPDPVDASIDLLVEIDLNRDPVVGSWELNSGVLSSTEKDPVAALRLPQTMPAEFELEIAAKRRSGVDLMFVNRSGETPFALDLQVKASAVDRTSDNGNSSSEKGAVFERGWAIDNPKPQTFVFRVTRDRLVIQRDGQTLVDEERYADLPADLPGVPERLGFFLVTEESKYEFSRIKLTPLGDE
jgi:hypothetical protein